MRQNRGFTTRLVALFILGCIFFNHPILSVFSRQDTLVRGIPLFYLFVYLFWAILIGLTAFFINHNSKNASSLLNRDRR